MAQNSDNKPQGEKKGFFSKLFSGPWFFVIIALVIFGGMFAGPLFSATNRVDTNVGMNLLNEQKVVSAKIHDGDQRVDLELRDDYTNAAGDNLGKALTFYYVKPRATEVVEAMNGADLESYTDQPVQTNWFTTMFSYMFPLIVVIAIFWFLLSRMGGGSSQIMNFSKSKAKKFNKDNPTVRFADVAGVDEALAELEEVREFLAEPEKFTRLGAKIPKGVLLYGPPGTGKTLLAKAVAGEAGVPFYSISGSDFVEMFVGVGASRVRDLFKEAKQNPAAIIFVDEIDAVGRQRGVGMGGGNDEREQTLNQLLVEMDGFDGTSNIIVIAATNRPDVLDPALLRPGRFDRQVGVDAPDFKGRQRILEVHATGKPIDRSVELSSVAKRTPGFTGADLANVMNEAALLTARDGGNVIDERAIDEAIDRVMAGPQRSSRIMNEHERKVTAYHEGGHALVAAALRNSSPVTKITILPRGRALGYTMVMPQDDKYSTTRHELLDQMAYAMGGRAAEEVVFHDPSTGASNDIQKATDTARKMVTEYGMSAKVGSVRLVSQESDPFLGGGSGGGNQHSDALAFTVDQEVQALLENAHDEAFEILTENRDVLDRLAFALLERETLLENEIAEIFKDVRKRPEREHWYSKQTREKTEIPPVKAPSELAGEKTSEEPAEGIVQQPVVDPDMGVEKPATDVNPTPGLGDNGGVQNPGGPADNPFGGAR
ncbi:MULTISPECIES: ATP-dependent zinc metalloprotease FtsH [unclassified Rothia (in: high G+C Gram-positive bacteria)]|uniref:ATP-dependent zinc metalloprotease FtsH n=1 Tax=unclassified Rothia (in: high G+C Gram-positive bacteria) TaxID=2689056 RepID=UPI00195A47EF|nr:MULTISPECIES: ATP-dependent zinc metalloprotease FtsH [unclassified Rothia (in: high G+C Gram-positive bacteria)]MBM7051616.1 ATP-dependent zinc metalloprotease FtsH [Rothia sp. ZJ1223]QRZ61750.1 ATP-dependent zinc metalloprotease FtsH [Rothia sp. ZJ932]